ncbi:MAG: PD40 domain-containing protein [Psychrobacter sp.]|uniref:PD40 domain-containing protein n=1 Tax=unclassified Psychrobacter TaxID=196806 RepID=UPI001787EFFE|nr:PD40 domain-containing protein [Psychrobacter sp. FME13]MBE0440760.1 PD40 domain-containing protein [Psychrobacter sp. FME13]
MLKAFVSKPTINLHTISSTVIIAATSVLVGCQTLPSTVSKTSVDMTASNPLTAKMPAIDRQGRIAYIEEHGMGAAKISTLYSIRPDGGDRQLVDQINGYIYSPAWSADGQWLAYSKQAARQNPKIYIYDRKSNTQSLIVNAEGSNMSASFSPDGQKLLYSSTVGGNADIYEMRLSDGNTKQLTTLSSTEVQPSYAPDGKSFVYTSDKVRAGRPSIYRYRFDDGKAERLSTGSYAASPQLSLDGQQLAYLDGSKAAIMTLATGQILFLAETGLDEPARLSPSGQYAVYPMSASVVSNQGSINMGNLVIQSLTGNTNFTISSEAGGVIRSPVWGR